MTIAEIKSQIGIKVLNIQQDLDETTQLPTDWVSHWDNDTRTRVSMHKDVFNQIMEDRDFDKLAVKPKEVKPATEEREAYTRYMIITPKNLLASI